MTTIKLFESTLDGWVDSYNRVPHKIIVCPLNERDIDLLDAMDGVRFIADAIHKKVYLFDATILHENVCRRVGLNYSFKPQEPIFCGIGKWSKSEKKVILYSSIGVEMSGRKNIKALVSKSYDFAEPYISGLVEKTNTLRKFL